MYVVWTKMAVFQHQSPLAVQNQGEVEAAATPGLPAVVHVGSLLKV